MPPAPFLTEIPLDLGDDAAWFATRDFSHEREPEPAGSRGDAPVATTPEVYL